MRWKIKKRNRVIAAQHYLIRGLVNIAKDLETSIGRRSQVGLSESIIWRILQKDLALRAFKVQITQE